MKKRLLGAAIVCVCLVLTAAPANGDAPLCNSNTYGTYTGTDCPSGIQDFCGSCCLLTLHYCGNGSQVGDPGMYCGCDDISSLPQGPGQCGDALGSPEVCGGSTDSNFDGCIGEGCTVGVGECTCEAKCDSPSCDKPQQATCDPSEGKPAEVCGDGVDNNCDGQVDENCDGGSGDGGSGGAGGAGSGGGPAPGPQPKPNSGGPSPDACGDKAGNDPLVLATQSAVTTPFADFAVDTGLLRLDLTRTYNSNDWSYAGGPTGIFGRGWHHDWEAWLSCKDGVCVVARGLARGFQFQPAGTALSLDGKETWQIYKGLANEVLTDDNQNILVRRPNGEWIVFLPSGQEWHFATVCDACASSSGDPFCQDAAGGGKARLIKVIDGHGNSVSVSYDRPSGLLFGLKDDLGHFLEVRSDASCSTGLASALRYDGQVVASYTYNGLDLDHATDGQGIMLRSYLYDAATTRLSAVKNESGDAIAEFEYDAYGRAYAVIDQYSSVQVNYDAPGGIQVTEFHGNTSSAGVRTLNRDGRISTISDGCACGPARTFQWTNRRLSCVSDAEGHVSWHDYDPQGRETYHAEYASTQGCSSRPSGLGANSREEWTGYDLVKPIAQGIGLPLTVVTSFSRRSALLGTIYVAESYSYDPAPQPIDPTGYSCQSSPLPVGSVVCRKIEAGYTMNQYGNILLERHATFYSYNGRGQLVQTLGPINLDNPSPNDVTPLEVRTYWSTSSSQALVQRGRLHTVKRYPSPTATPLTTTYDYDMFGPYKITDPNGKNTTIIKDGRGRPSTISAQDGGQTQVRYHDGLDPRVTISPTGAAARYTYDSMGRVQIVEYLSSDPDVAGSTPTLGWSEHYVYDPAGNRTHTERQDGSGVVTWVQDRQYDVQHRVVFESNPEKSTVNKATLFDPTGFLQQITDEVGRGTVFAPDGLNRVSTVTRNGVDSKGAPVSLQVAQYKYTPYSDSLSSLVDGNGRTTSYTYDDFGRLVRMAASLSVSVQYDARGNMLQRAIGQTRSEVYTYDGLDRLLTTNVTDSSSGSSIAYVYHYDEPPYPGRLTSVVEPDRTVQYTYDSVGRLTGESVQENGITAPLKTGYVYNKDGTLKQITYPSGLIVTVGRDSATRQVSYLKDATTGTYYANSVKHLPGGPVRKFTFGNGLTLSRTFNKRYEPSGLTSGPLSVTYKPTLAGDVQSAKEGTTTRKFSYDFLDRLTDSPSWFVYGYDNNGNRTSETVQGPAATYTYVYGTEDVAQKLMTSGTTQVPQYGFVYDYQDAISGIGAFDASGSSVTAAVCLRHDALGRLVMAGSVATAYLNPSQFNGGTGCQVDAWVSSPTAKFKYDARNRRVARWSGSTNSWTYIVSDTSGNPLSEVALTSMGWVPVRDYLWLDGAALAQIEYPGATPTTGYAYYYHLDQIGLPRVLTNQNGQVVWSAAARPYGDLTETATADPVSGRTVVSNLRLPGQYDERLLGNVGMQGPYYNWNRWYLPVVGKYLESDPLAWQGYFNTGAGLDWYGYAAGNPLRSIDKSGLLPGDGTGKGVPCSPSDTTVGCCLKQFPGQYERCGALPPDQKPMDTTPTTEQQPPAPDVKPFKPGRADAFRLCVAACKANSACKANPALQVVCMAVCVAGALNIDG